MDDKSVEGREEGEGGEEEERGGGEMHFCLCLAFMCSVFGEWNYGNGCTVGLFGLL